MTFQGTPYQEKPEAYRTKFCKHCGVSFIALSGNTKYCGNACYKQTRPFRESQTAENQYKRISGSWDRYFARLLQRSFRRNLLSREILHRLLEEQKGLCALSGIPLTCTLEVGKRFKTNASIDRLRPGEPYSEDNIQLVCSALNSWRNDTELSEFIWFCKKVADYHKETPSAVYEDREREVGT